MSSEETARGAVTFALSTESCRIADRRRRARYRIERTTVSAAAGFGALDGVSQIGERHLRAGSNTALTHIEAPPAR